MNPTVSHCCANVRFPKFVSLNVQRNKLENLVNTAINTVTALNGIKVAGEVTPRLAALLTPRGKPETVADEIQEFALDVLGTGASYFETGMTPEELRDFYNAKSDAQKSEGLDKDVRELIEAIEDAERTLETTGVRVVRALNKVAHLFGGLSHPVNL